MKRIHFTARRIVLDAMLIALFFVLSTAGIRIGNAFRITFDSLACLLTAMLFGPMDAFFVGFAGEFLAQMLSYGFTATTLLWMLAPALRGLILGWGVRLFGARMSFDAIRSRKPLSYFAVVGAASVVTSLGNTLALYVDAKMFGYYEYHMVFGVMLIRVGNGLVSSLAAAVLAIPILGALRASRVIAVHGRKA